MTARPVSDLRRLLINDSLTDMAMIVLSANECIYECHTCLEREVESHRGRQQR